MLQSCPPLCDLTYRSPPGSSVQSTGVSRQEYWRGMPCPAPGDLPDPGIKPMSLPSPALAGRFFTTSIVVAMRSGKQTHSEGQSRQWRAVYYTGGPKAESPLSQGSRQVSAKTLHTLSICAQTHLPKFPETSLNKGKERYSQS